MNLRNQILEFIKKQKNGIANPVKMGKYLVKQGVNEETLRECLSEMIDRHELVITRDWCLKIAE